MKTFVPHPRYGASPAVSGLSLPEETVRSGHWQYGRGKIFIESVLIADTAKQNYALFPRLYYVDAERVCRHCERPFIFFAQEQKHWFETLGFYVDADCVFCCACRRDSQSAKYRLRRYSTLLAKPDPTRHELMTLVDDGAYLLRRGILRDLGRLGRLKNEALRQISEYRGTELFVTMLRAAHELRELL